MGRTGRREGSKELELLDFMPRDAIMSTASVGTKKESRLRGPLVGCGA